MHQQQTDEQGASEDLNRAESTLSLDQPPHPPTWSFDAGPTPADDAAGPSNASRTSLFSSNPPSIFSSAPSTSPSLTTDSVRPSVISTSPPNSLRPLAALSGSSTATVRRTARFEDEASLATRNNNRMEKAEKDADDPTTPVESRRSIERREYTTLTTLSRLFAAQSSPVSSRAPSYHQSAGPAYMRSFTSEAASLPDHLYTRGLLEGRHSDITVGAFGQKYALHRLILDRAPFFTTALSEPWIESQAKEITLHPEEIDSSITQNAFELALKRLYGCDVSQEEDAEAIGLFATGCWLEMQDLVDSSIDAILRQMSPETLSPLIRLVTANYYGRSGERILASAKSMLCRDGWEMPLKYWDAIPGDIIREIVGGDGFFIDGEWDRWVLAKRLLDRRLKQKAIEAGLIEKGKKTVVKAPDMLCLMAVRFDAVYRQNSMTASRLTPDSHHSWLALYTNPDIEPLLVLLDEGIHYIHLDFEQLQFIRKACDILGLPVMPEKVISNALWQQMELRQKVVNAGDLDMELGLSKPAEEPSANQQTTLTKVSSNDSASSSPSKGKRKLGTQTPEEDDGRMGSGSWDANGKPRKFWIPSTDCNIVMGGNAEPVVTTSNSFQRHASRLSATLQPEDAQWATDFASSPSTSTNPNTRTDYPARPGSASGSNAGQPKPIAYTHYPPFRFSAEFPNPRLLKEKKRVYSRTVFYAGSLWNIYIQKVRSAKNVQLGVYLHRAKEREAEEVVSGGTGLAQNSIGTVDERIGLLEREMLLRSERRDRRRGRGGGRPDQNEQPTEEDTSGSGGDPDATLVSTGSRNPLFSSTSALARRRHHLPLHNHQSSGPFARPTSSSSGPAPGNSSNSNLLNFPALSPSPPDGDIVYSAYTYAPPSPYATSDDSENEDPDTTYPNPTLSLLVPRKSRAATPTLPPYVDARPTIKTYFKIYSPSKGGRLLSVYESAPDRFNFSQSWGWKSSTLMLDEVALNGREEGSQGSEQGQTEGTRGGLRRASDGKLRFMVVIGNL